MLKRKFQDSKLGDNDDNGNDNNNSRVSATSVSSLTNSNTSSLNDSSISTTSTSKRPKNKKTSSDISINISGGGKSTGAVLVNDNKPKSTTTPDSDDIDNESWDHIIKGKSDDEIIEILCEKFPFKINSLPKERPIRIYCDGIFDLFHLGHAEALRKAKMYFSDVYLMVGVCNDLDTHSKKGKTVMNERERALSLSHCRWVDEVIEEAPWIITQEFIDLHNIHYVAHDPAPYPSETSDDVYGFIKKQGRFLPLSRTEGISTSDLITRIIRDYDKFLERNLERGISPKELGLGYLKEKEYIMKKLLSNITSSIHQNWRETKVDLSNDLSELKNDLAQAFASMFNGGEGVLDKILRRRRPHNKRTLSNDSGEEESSSNKNDTSASDEDNNKDDSRGSSPVRKMFGY